MSCTNITKEHKSSAQRLFYILTHIDSNKYSAWCAEAARCVCLYYGCGPVSLAAPSSASGSPSLICEVTFAEAEGVRGSAAKLTLGTACSRFIAPVLDPWLMVLPLWPALNRTDASAISVTSTPVVGGESGGCTPRNHDELECVRFLSESRSACFLVRTTWLSKTSGSLLGCAELLATSTARTGALSPRIIRSECAATSAYSITSELECCTGALVPHSMW